MTLNIVRQHPRFVIAILFGTLCLVLMRNAMDGAFTSPPYFMQAYPPPGAGAGESGLDIPWRLRKSEETYQRTLKQRVELIKKYGPSKTDIVPWPRDHKYYTLWDFFTASFNCPYEVERVGILGDGGKWVCGLSRLAKKPGCTIYSFGINDESSFEAGLLERTRDCEVWGYDFSVKDFGPEIREIPSLKSRGHFFAQGLSGKDDPAGDPPMYTLQSLMRKNGHNFIDILKIDIEGWEFPALRSIFKAYHGKPLPFGQLQLEIHADRLPDVKQEDVFTEFLAWWEELEGAGLRPFWTEPNLVFVNINLGTVPALAEYSFINIRGNHDIIR